MNIQTAFETETTTYQRRSFDLEWEIPKNARRLDNALKCLLHTISIKYKIQTSNEWEYGRRKAEKVESE